MIAEHFKMAVNKKLVTMLLIFLMLIRIGMAVALIYGFPEKSNYIGGYFYLSDEEEYFKLAFSLAGFKAIDSYRTLGFPILLLPFIWMSKVNDFHQLLLPVAIFHACILAPISIVLIAFIAKRLTRDWGVALFSAAIWAFFPYLVYAFIHTKPSFCKDVPAMRMAHQMWLQALSDPPSVFLVFLAISAFLISLNKNKIIYALLTGITFGLAALVRPANIMLAVLFLPFYLRKEKLKNLFLFAASSFFTATPQLVYNWRFYGSPFKFTTFFAIEKSYAVELIPLFGRTPAAFSIENFLFFFRQIILKFPPVLLILIFIVFLVITHTLFRLYRQCPRSAIILALWILPYFFIYGTYSYFYNSILHFLMPATPAFIIIISIFFKRTLWFL